MIFQVSNFRIKLTKRFCSRNSRLGAIVASLFERCWLRRFWKFWYFDLARFCKPFLERFLGLRGILKPVIFLSQILILKRHGWKTHEKMPLLLGATSDKAGSAKTIEVRCRQCLFQRQFASRNQYNELIDYEITDYQEKNHPSNRSVS
jgi:hypothetical protein